MNCCISTHRPEAEKPTAMAANRLTVRATYFIARPLNLSTLTPDEPLSSVLVKYLLTISILSSTKTNATRAATSPVTTFTEILCQTQTDIPHLCTKAVL